jgi:hypothetical protein
MLVVMATSLVVRPGCFAWLPRLFQRVRAAAYQIVKVQAVTRTDDKARRAIFRHASYF